MEQNEATLKKRGAEEVELSSLEENIPSDTQLVIDSIRQSAIKNYGLILLHQVYSTMKNKSIVDEELLVLRTKSISYKCLNCSFLQSKSSKNIFTGGVSIISIFDYISSIRTYLQAKHSIIAEKFVHWVKLNTQMSVFRGDLKRKPGHTCTADSPAKRVKTYHLLEEEDCLTDTEIDILIQTGFLSYRNNIETSRYDDIYSCTSGAQTVEAGDLFWLSHPALRSLVVCLQRAEQEIIAQIKTGRYKEISQKKLQSLCPSSTSLPYSHTSSNNGAHSSISKSTKKGILKDSPFPLSYHLLDLQGRGVIFKVPAPATGDFILRLCNN